MTHPTRVLVVGGGNVGTAVAMRLQKHLGKQLRRDAVQVTEVAPDPYMTYQPFLAESAAGSVQPRHVVVPPVPGLAEHGIGFTSIEEAIGLRNHVLAQPDIASSTRDAAVREAALTFVFVGGGYARVEALAELEDMARYATRYDTGVRPEDMRRILVEAGDRILPEVGARLGGYAVRRLRERGVDVRQARVLAGNPAAALRGAPLRAYRHRYAGSVASPGLHKGIASVYGHRLKGYPAWLMHRAYHLGKLPTVGRKAHVLAEWTGAGLFKREVVALGSLEHPRAEFELATRSGRGPDGD
ncbi:FAD-dependent oxidoreductase [Streptomyces sp. WMMC500]|uniref:NAD(P)/FAD-dependent oxidoreductase n=1 Tax=Streptomyces sp. WMMC500 TaxID=3015154 RepID=UPI00248BA3D6|nr:FAD-dependent oxidoreductase [Streptomyces sp. WMMC500]WBB63967.1 FAD-dependent oxidoreductase [Streptomyces sp. WMMC500]